VPMSARARRSMTPSLATIGGERILEFGEVIGYGVPPMPDFWIGPRTTGEGFRESHIAFSAPDRAAVRAFFEAGKAAGADVLHEPGGLAGISPQLLWRLLTGS
jgi:catechol 2,3-dioxygenase-like lactoylglutathione lyase family enzyme